MQDDNTIRLGSVYITETSISEVQDGIQIVEVPKSEISKIELIRAVSAERPLLQFITGLILTVPGFYFSRVIWEWFFNGGVLYADITLAATLLIPLGLWIAFSAYRKRILFLVHSGNKKRKILCDPKNSLSEINRFADSASQRFGYVIENILN